MTSALRSLYGPAYDFPNGTSAIKSYVIATAPRCGSTFLALELWRTGNLGAPLEYFNLDRLRRWGCARERVALDDYCQSLRQRRTSLNGVFGFKIFADFAYQMKVSYPALHAQLFHGARLIWLHREDVVAQAVSLALALQTKRWFSIDDEKFVPAYDLNLLLKALYRINANDRYWRHVQNTTSQAIIDFTYEQLCEDVSGVVERVAAYLEVDLSEACVQLPLIDSQTTDLNREWATRFLMDLKHQGTDRELLGGSATHMAITRSHCRAKHTGSRD